MSFFGGGTDTLDIGKAIFGGGGRTGRIGGGGTTKIPTINKYPQSVVITKKKPDSNIFGDILSTLIEPLNTAVGNITKLPGQISSDIFNLGTSITGDITQVITTGEREVGSTVRAIGEDIKAAVIESEKELRELIEQLEKNVVDVVSKPAAEIGSGIATGLAIAIPVGIIGLLIFVTIA